MLISVMEVVITAITMHLDVGAAVEVDEADEEMVKEIPKTQVTL